MNAATCESVRRDLTGSGCHSAWAKSTGVACFCVPVGVLTTDIGAIYVPGISSQSRVQSNGLTEQCRRLWSRRSDRALCESKATCGTKAAEDIEEGSCGQALRSSLLCIRSGLFDDIAATGTATAPVDIHLVNKSCIVDRGGTEQASQRGTTGRVVLEGQIKCGLRHSCLGYVSRVQHHPIKESTYK